MQVFQVWISEIQDFGMFKLSPVVSEPRHAISNNVVLGHWLDMVYLPGGIL